MMARNRCTRRRSVCMWSFQWRSLRGIGEFVGGMFVFATVILALNLAVII